MPHKFCTYDNPKTMCREQWFDGKMTSHVSINLLYDKSNVTEVVRKFVPGSCIGDVEAVFEPDAQICVWPDSTICEKSEVHEYTHMSDDYEVIDVLTLENGDCVDYKGNKYEF